VWVGVFVYYAGMSTVCVCGCLWVSFCMRACIYDVL